MEENPKILKEIIMAKFAKAPTSFICLRLEGDTAILSAVVYADDPRHKVEVAVPSYGRFEKGVRYGMGYIKDARSKVLQDIFSRKYRELGI